MRIRYVLGFTLLGISLLGCGRSDDGSGTGSGSGSGSGSTEPPIPVSHTLARSMPVTISAGAFYGLSFFLPVQGTLRFSANQTTTDTWNVAVFTPAQWISYQNGSGNQATGAIHNGVMQVSDSIVLPKGEWYLGFRCTNIVQRCMFLFDAEAIY